ncbi:CRISPR-associated endonuclease Cas2 [Candidatus Methylomicrobium oryzae]|jgi:CRISPR-associated protein Cas2|uniref:CRISPR-associated endonuclease Cas2 n=1 Tax=Candidatus Methylomicrobium oryzae TaxID=2802053 RepID=UPI001920B26A|nr:CRISPR-associated endonuclease Cas2 [Methylomicrobium sp. RS1]MBL1263951.1 CRISPR-associated endonuclease Cas2 [Methylomicrobium sp. RS1]
MAAYEYLYLVTYDISDPKRWRRVFKLMKGYGDWLQLSVFQCRLSRKRHAELIALLDGIIHHTEDHVLIINVGPAESVKPQVVSLGKEFEMLERQPVIV